MKKICFITSSRADYGLLYPLLKKIKSNPRLQLSIVVTGSHLSKEYGSTYKEIIKDAFTISKKVTINLDDNSNQGIARAMGQVLDTMPSVLKSLKPELVIVLGDRFEIFASVCAAYILKIPIAHIAGGETTEGAYDEAFRHSITKMSQLHFTSTEVYRKRVIQLGEQPNRVYNVGSLSADSIKLLKLMNKDDIENKYKIKFKKYNYLITYHPTTLDTNTFKNFDNLLNVLSKMTDSLLIFTKSNCDTGGRSINRKIDQFVANHQENTCSFTSCGSLFYLSLMSHVDAVVGNSSSGIVEAPLLKIPTINIGNRQKGRLRTRSIIDCLPDINSIKSSIDTTRSKEFKKNIQNMKCPYGDGNTARKIDTIISQTGAIDIHKRYYDIDYTL